MLYNLFIHSSISHSICPFFHFREMKSNKKTLNDEISKLQNEITELKKQIHSLKEQLQ